MKIKKFLKCLVLVLSVFCLANINVKAIEFDENNIISLPDNLVRNNENKIDINFSGDYESSYLLKDVTNNSDFISAYSDYKLNQDAKDGLESAIESIINEDNFDELKNNSFKPDSIPTSTDSVQLLIINIKYNDPDSGESKDIYKYKVYEVKKEETSSNNKDTSGSTTSSDDSVENSETGISDVLYILVPILLIAGVFVSNNKKRYS